MLYSGESFIVTFYFRSSHPRCSMKNVVLKNLAKLTGKHLLQSFSLIKLLRKTILKNISERLLWLFFYFPEHLKEAALHFTIFQFYFFFICYIFRFMVLHVLRDFYAVKICPRRGKCPLSGMHTPSLKYVIHILQ